MENDHPKRSFPFFAGSSLRSSSTSVPKRTLSRANSRAPKFSFVAVDRQPINPRNPEHNRRNLTGNVGKDLGKDKAKPSSILADPAAVEDPARLAKCKRTEQTPRPQNIQAPGEDKTSRTNIQKVYGNHPENTENTSQLAMASRQYEESVEASSKDGRNTSDDVSNMSTARLVRGLRAGRGTGADPDPEETSAEKAAREAKDKAIDEANARKLADARKSHDAALLAAKYQDNQASRPGIILSDNSQEELAANIRRIYVDVHESQQAAMNNFQSNMLRDIERILNAGESEQYLRNTGNRHNLWIYRGNACTPMFPEQAAIDRCLSCVNDYRTPRKATNTAWRYRLCPHWRQVLDVTDQWGDPVWAFGGSQNCPWCGVAQGTQATGHLTICPFYIKEIGIEYRANVTAYRSGLEEHADFVRLQREPNAFDGRPPRDTGATIPPELEISAYVYQPTVGRSPSLTPPPILPPPTRTSEGFWSDCAQFPTIIDGAGPVTEEVEAEEVEASEEETDNEEVSSRDVTPADPPEVYTDADFAATHPDVPDTYVRIRNEVGSKNIRNFDSLDLARNKKHWSQINALASTNRFKNAVAKGKAHRVHGVRGIWKVPKQDKACAEKIEKWARAQTFKRPFWETNTYITEANRDFARDYGYMNRLPNGVLENDTYIRTQLGKSDLPRSTTETWVPPRLLPRANESWFQSRFFTDDNSYRRWRKGKRNLDGRTDEPGHPTFFYRYDTLKRVMWYGDTGTMILAPIKEAEDGDTAARAVLERKKAEAELAKKKAADDATKEAQKKKEESAKEEQRKKDEEAKKKAIDEEAKRKKDEEAKKKADDEEERRKRDEAVKDAERKAKEKKDADERERREREEEAERIRKEKAEQERAEKEKKDRKEKERIEREEKEKKDREEKERIEREDKEKKDREEKERIEREDKEKNDREEKARIEREEKEKRDREEKEKKEKDDEKKKETVKADREKRYKFDLVKDGRRKLTKQTTKKLIESMETAIPPPKAKSGKKADGTARPGGRWCIECGMWTTSKNFDQKGAHYEKCYPRFLKRKLDGEIPSDDEGKVEVTSPKPSAGKKKRRGTIAVSSKKKKKEDEDKDGAGATGEGGGEGAAPGDTGLRGAIYSKRLAKAFKRKADELDNDDYTSLISPEDTAEPDSTEPSFSPESDSSDMILQVPRDMLQGTKRKLGNISQTRAEDAMTSESDESGLDKSMPPDFGLPDKNLIASYISESESYILPKASRVTNATMLLSTKSRIHKSFEDGHAEIEEKTFQRALKGNKKNLRVFKEVIAKIVTAGKKTFTYKLYRFEDGEDTGLENMAKKRKLSDDSHADEESAREAATGSQQDEMETSIGRELIEEVSNIEEGDISQETFNGTTVKSVLFAPDVVEKITVKKYRKTPAVIGKGGKKKKNTQSGSASRK